MSNKQIIDRLVASDNLQEAIEIITHMIVENPQDAELYFMRGKIYWRAGARAAAIADYSRAVELSPDSPARHALEQAKDIADFFNPDLYNP